MDGLADAFDAGGIGIDNDDLARIGPRTGGDRVEVGRHDDGANFAFDAVDRPPVNDASGRRRFEPRRHAGRRRHRNDCAGSCRMRDARRCDRGLDAVFHPRRRLSARPVDARHVRMGGRWKRARSLDGHHAVRVEPRILGEPAAHAVELLRRAERLRLVCDAARLTVRIAQYEPGSHFPGTERVDQDFRVVHRDAIHGNAFIAQCKYECLCKCVLVLRLVDCHADLVVRLTPLAASAHVDVP